MIFSAQELASATGGVLETEGPAGPISTDTRKVTKGDWFLALKGPNFDAHDFLDRAHEAGAVGVVAERVPAGWTAGHIRVPDGLRALQDIGCHVRQGYRGPVIGITGSTGKTTTRSLIGLALSPLGEIHETAGNLNNHIGLPLTLLDAPVGADAWVLELGMNHSGEIHDLQAICQPTIRLITNVGAAHIEGLGSIEAVARAKGELFDGARPGDVLCVNMDDPRVAALPQPEGCRIVRYGSSMECDVRLTDAAVDPVTLETRFRIETPSGRVLSHFASPGLHLAQNACAAVAVARVLRVPFDQIGPALNRYVPVGMRMAIEDLPSGVKVINDAYNANPMSMAASLRTLAAVPRTEGVRRIALLGDMLELGATEVAEHAHIIQLADNLDLDLIGLVGPRFGAAAGSDSPHLLAQDAVSLGRKLRDQLTDGDVVLLKGSRGLGMEQVLQGMGSPTEEPS